jgi:thiosulfate dehydrogenase
MERAMRRFLIVTALFAGVLMGAALTHDAAHMPRSMTASAAGNAFVPAPMPTGAEGDLINYGKNILENTRKYAGKYAVANMSCEACHMSAGTKAHAGSLVGVYAKFPQYNARSKRFIALQDRLAECFFYSMNGTSPPFDSRDMIALTAYIAYISRGTVVGKGAPDQGLVTFKPPAAPSAANGAKVYATTCVACHGANGSGGSAFPPLWGSTSFNAGAGMHRLGTMAAFVRYNMPYGAPPNTLTAQQAYDVSAVVLSHPRPKFNGQRLVSFPARKASFY